MASTINASTTLGLISTADTSGILQLQTANTAALTIDGSQNVGVGTSSPSASFKLDVTGLIRSNATANGGGQYTVSKNGTTVGVLCGSGNVIGSAATDLALYAETGNAVSIFTNGSATARATFDTSGNLGLGVTPSAWGTDNSVRALQFNAGSIYSFATTVMYFNQNAFRNSSGNRQYSTTAAATEYEQSGGVHKWFNAPSGTAGNAITFTQAATLTANGEWLVGATATVNAAKAVFSFSSANNGVYIVDSTGVSNAQFMRFDSTSGTCGSITRVGTTSAVLYNTSSDYRLKNITGLITTSGSYIDSLNPVEGTWKADGSTFVGLIAHEVQEASRTQVATGTKDGEEMQAMDYSNSELIANLIAEVKSLRQRVATLEAQ